MVFGNSVAAVCHWPPSKSTARSRLHSKSQISDSKLQRYSPKPKTKVQRPKSKVQMVQSPKPKPSQSRRFRQFRALRSLPVALCQNPCPTSAGLQARGDLAVRKKCPDAHGNSTRRPAKAIQHLARQVIRRRHRQGQQRQLSGERRARRKPSSTSRCNSTVENTQRILLPPVCARPSTSKAN